MAMISTTEFNRARVVAIQKFHRMKVDQLSNSCRDKKLGPCEAFVDISQPVVFTLWGKDGQTQGAPAKSGQGMTSMTMRLSEKSQARLEAARRISNEKLGEAERECLREFSEGLATQWGVECRLATINANGLRENARKDALAAFLIDFYINICVVSETHLRSDDITGVKKYFLDYGYTVEAHCCRETGGGRIRGGVIILVHIGLPSVTLEKVPLPAAPVDACSLCVCPTAKRSDRIRITGIYCPHRFQKKWREKCIKNTCRIILRNPEGVLSLAKRH